MLEIFMYRKPSSSNQYVKKTWRCNVYTDMINRTKEPIKT